MQKQEPARREQPFFHHAQTGDDFETALRFAASQNATSMKNLHDAIKNCVRNLRSEGMECESALLTIKACVKHTLGKLDHDGLHPARSEFVMDQIVRWSISEFFIVD